MIVYITFPCDLGVLILTALLTSCMTFSRSLGLHFLTCKMKGLFYNDRSFFTFSPSYTISKQLVCPLYLWNYPETTHLSYLCRLYLGPSTIISYQAPGTISSLVTLIPSCSLTVHLPHRSWLYF